MFAGPFHTDIIDFGDHVFCGGVFGLFGQFRDGRDIGEQDHDIGGRIFLAFLLILIKSTNVCRQQKFRPGFSGAERVLLLKFVDELFEILAISKHNQAAEDQQAHQ